MNGKKAKMLRRVIKLTLQSRELDPDGLERVDSRANPERVGYKQDYILMHSPTSPRGIYQAMKKNIKRG